MDTKPATTARFKVGLLVLFVVNASSLAQAEELQLPVARWFHRAAVIDKQIHLFGGFPGSDSPGNRRLDILDPATGKWSSGQTTPPHYGTFYGAQIDGRLFTVGGQRNSLHVYDPKDSAWRPVAAIPTKSANCSVIAFDGKLYVIGGYSEKITRKNSVQIYDPTENEWSLGPPLPKFEVHDHMHLLAVLGGRLHVVGGLIKDRDRPHWVLMEDEWQARAAPPIDCLWKHHVLEAVEERLYLMSFGKEDGSVFSYRDKDDRWTKLGPTPENAPIGLFASAVVDKTIYVLGGMRLESGATRDVYRFDTVTGRWTTPGK